MVIFCDTADEITLSDLLKICGKEGAEVAVAVATDDPSRIKEGLAMTIKIIHDHDGHISVASEVGQGTTFSIKLPITSTENPV